MEKLSYDEWRKHYTVNVSESVIEEMQKFHNVDARAEVEKAMQYEYQNYLIAQE